MGQPAARISDLHTCPAHVGGPIISGQANVLIGGLPAARQGDQLVCADGVDTIAEGEPTVLIGGKPAARIGDRTAHGGVVITGCGNVLIGKNPGKCLADAAQTGESTVHALDK